MEYRDAKMVQSSTPNPDADFSYDLLAIKRERPVVSGVELARQAAEIHDDAERALDDSEEDEDVAEEKKKRHANLNYSIAKSVLRKELAKQSGVLETNRNVQVSMRKRRIIGLENEIRHLKREIILINRNHDAARGVLRHKKIDLSLTKTTQD